MKQRIVSAGIGLIILAVVLAFYDTILFNIVIAAIAIIAVYEVLLATKYLKNKVLAGVCFGYVVAISFTRFIIDFGLFPVLSYLFILLLFLIVLSEHNRMQVEQIGFSFFMTLLIGFSFTTAVFLRDRFGMVLGIYYTLFALGSAWLSDTGAYFAGRAFGKHKLAPTISPKKTIEGAIGGVIFALVTLVLISMGYSWICNSLGVPVTVNYLRVLLLVPLCSVTGIVGDLSASIIKRQCSIKDFGDIMPGHGGILDRFDSVLFVMPLVYIIAIFFPIATLG